jgi:uncharacterized membrane protein
MSARNLRITLTVFTVAGLGIASYLTFIHYSGIKVICTAGESCTKVETSVYSELAGVPVALLGVLGYTTILGLLLAPENETTRFAMTAFTLVGFAFSAYLTYRELYVWRFLRGTTDLSASGPTGPSLALRGLTAPARRSS